MRRGYFFRVLREVDRREGFEGGTRKKVSLKEANILVGQPRVLGDGFNAFGNHVDAEFETPEADGANDSLTRSGAFDTAGQPHVEFDLIGLEVGEQVEAGIGRAKVVYGQPDAERAHFVHEAGEMGAASDDIGLRDFEDDAVYRDTGPLGGLDGGVNRPRIGVEALGEEIQVERAIDAEASGECDRFRARGLIEEVQAERRDLVEDLPGGLVPCAANQGFPGDDFARDGIDDRLKGEAESRVDGELRFGAHGAPSEWGRDGMARLGREG